MRLLTVVAAVLAFLAWKIVPGFLAASIASQALGTVFGGPYDRLPADFRTDVERRLEAAVPNVDELDEAGIRALWDRAFTDGVLRLDDASVLRYFTAFGAAMRAMDDSMCGSIAGAWLAGRDPPEGYDRLAAAIEPDALQAIIAVGIDALEASVRKSPERRTVTEADATPLLGELVAGMDAASVATFISIGNGNDVSDAEACHSFRALFERMERLDEQTRARLLRYMLT
jgi:hypothetical protein